MPHARAGAAGADLGTVFDEGVICIADRSCAKVDGRAGRVEAGRAVGRTTFQGSAGWLGGAGVRTLAWRAAVGSRIVAMGLALLTP